MAYWLADKREGQDSDFLQRFDADYWTVDFPRPAMASIITQRSDTVRVDCEFHHRNELVGLIWDSEDRFDHPLLGYATDRDYSRTTLTFLWTSRDVRHLDEVNGPTLTIEGRDTDGNARSWFVRLWKYAEGAPNRATVTLPFSNLREGWLADGDLVNPAAIDRMFISIVPPGYDPADPSPFAQATTGVVGLSNIRVAGERAMLELGDVILPANGSGMATAYDDSYNLAPGRVLRNLRHLGYTGDVVHYLGMSHFFRLQRQPDGALLVDPAGTLSLPAISWHSQFLVKCKALGIRPILSLSYELLDVHCPSAWKQRAHNGTAARTGWEPPSTLLSPANPEAMAYLRSVAAKFLDLARTRSMAVAFQIGEPWWWVTADTRAPCLYDDAARAVLASRVPSVPAITDLRTASTPAELALLDAAGAILAESIADLAAAARAAYGGPLEVMLLAFTPTILDAATPEARRANLPTGWAWPAYDRLQVEDYDWLTAGAEALRRKAYKTVQARLGYPLDRQDYLAGFVLDPADRERFWALIDAGLDEARARGVVRTFVWALPQVCRDGYVRLPYQEKQVQPFDDLLYPLALGRDAGVSPEFSTSIALTASGHERRNSQWSDARLHYDVGPGIRGETDLGVLLEFFRARRGPARGFRLADPFDFSSNGLTGTPTATDQLIGIGDGLTASFWLRKNYGSSEDPQQRPITRPRADTVLVSVDGVPTTDWVLEPGGPVIFTDAPGAGQSVRAGFLFDVPVRFAEDRLDITGATFRAGEAPSVPLIELREEL
ncbi:DUF2460 domain-containing protein [Aurantiacibacter luteus]|uniref:TIGR02217 family protein n=1 Tax=Aurantiacibacter luteus TaxID=1581420 RepID=A0A0G9MV49_9SPHN|nr:DUF2460 domain-containing protein [Aurantiacibacter luteus]KLE34459.1 hypothetical protein AAW00_09565 [Aurantiacibacter luteus]